MVNSEKDYGEQLWALGKGYAQESTAIWQRYARLVTNTQQDITPENIGERFSKFCREDSPEFIRDLVQLQTNYFLEAMKMGMDFNRQFYDKLFKSNSNKGSNTRQSQSQIKYSTFQTKHEADSVATDIPFQGKIGDKIIQPFVVANNESQTIDVSFELSDFVSENGETIDQAKLSFHPDVFKLEGGKDQIVECCLVPDKRFKTGTEYVAIARVIGFPNMLVRFVLKILENGT